jgi:hypothetical protein
MRKIFRRKAERNSSHLHIQSGRRELARSNDSPDMTEDSLVDRTIQMESIEWHRTSECV